MVEYFVEEHRFLSNFHIFPLEFEGKVYMSAEHAYQAAKTTDPKQKELVRGTSLPGNAKKMGRLIDLRPDWDLVKDDVMYRVLKAKFKDETLAEKLLATGDAILVERNWWGDIYWGVCRGVGQNKLGRLLMVVRDELREEKEKMCQQG